MSTSDSFTLKVALVVKRAFDASIVRDFEEKSGLTVNIEWAPTTVIMSDLEKGASPDGVIVTDDALRELASKGIVDSADSFPLIESRIGLGCREGETPPDISTVEALKTTLVNCRAVSYSLGGQSGLYFAPLLERLGIAEAVNSRAVRIPEGFTGEKVISGEADIAVQQLSELLSVSGIEIIGELPAEVQKISSFSGGPCIASENKENVKKFFEFLKSDSSAIEFGKSGLTSR